MRLKSLTIVLLLLSSLSVSSDADAATVIYDDELRPGWTSWSWDGEFIFDYADKVLAGTYSILAVVEQYGSLSLRFERPFPGATGIVFWLRGDGPTLELFLQTGEGAGTVDSEAIPISDVAEVTPDEWAFVSIDFAEITVDAWNRVAIRSTAEAGGTFVVDEIVLQGVDLTADVPADEEPDMGLDTAEEPSDVGLDATGDGSVENEPDAGSDTAAPDAAPDAAPEDDGGDGWGCRVTPSGGAGRSARLALVFGLLAWLTVRRR